MGYQGIIIRFRPIKNLISAKVVGKLELLPHSIGPTLPKKSHNAKIELIELFQAKCDIKDWVIFHVYFYHIPIRPPLPSLFSHSYSNTQLVVKCFLHHVWYHTTNRLRNFRIFKRSLCVYVVIVLVNFLISLFLTSLARIFKNYVPRIFFYK